MEFLAAGTGSTGCHVKLISIGLTFTYHQYPPVGLKHFRLEWIRLSTCFHLFLFSSADDGLQRNARLVQSDGRSARQRVRPADRSPQMGRRTARQPLDPPALVVPAQIDRIFERVCELIQDHVGSTRIEQRSLFFVFFPRRTSRHRRTQFAIFPKKMDCILTSGRVFLRPFF